MCSPGPRQPPSTTPAPAHCEEAAGNNRGRVGRHRSPGSGSLRTLPRPSSVTALRLSPARLFRRFQTVGRLHDGERAGNWLSSKNLTALAGHTCANGMGAPSHSSFCDEAKFKRWSRKASVAPWVWVWRPSKPVHGDLHQLRPFARRRQQTAPTFRTRSHRSHRNPVPARWVPPDALLALA